MNKNVWTKKYIHMEILSCLLLQKYTNDRPAPLFFRRRSMSIHRIILQCKVMCQPSSLTPHLNSSLVIDPSGIR
jgi:hypothetical protein